jgi:hypothetical protein
MPAGAYACITGPRQVANNSGAQLQERKDDTGQHSGCYLEICMRRDVAYVERMKNEAYLFHANEEKYLIILFLFGKEMCISNRGKDNIIFHLAHFSR